MNPSKETPMKDGTFKRKGAALAAAGLLALSGAAAAGCGEDDINDQIDQAQEELNNELDNIDEDVKNQIDEATGGLGSEAEELQNQAEELQNQAEEQLNELDQQIGGGE